MAHNVRKKYANEIYESRAQERGLPLRGYVAADRSPPGRWVRGPMATAGLLCRKTCANVSVPIVLARTDCIS